MQFKYMLTDLMSREPVVHCADDEYLSREPLRLNDLLEIADIALKDFEEDGIGIENEEEILFEFNEERHSSGFFKELYVLHRKNWLARRNGVPNYPPSYDD